MDLVHHSASELLQRMTGGSVTAVEVCQAFLQQIDQHDRQVGAFLHVDSDQVLQQAADIDRRRQADQPVGGLAGLPVAIKDAICTQGTPTTCGSKMLKGFTPPYDATVVARLRQADAILLGKTNLDEFAMGGSTENSALGQTTNPWDASRVPGGSSGGAAACVAARMAPLSLGSDTGGSIRQPASFCGVTGLKPTYGRVSRYGLIAFASSLDQIGPLANSVEDTALLLNVIAGIDPRDATSAPHDVPDYAAALRQPLTGVTLGVVQQHFGDGLDAQVQSAIEESIRVYKSLGARIVDASLPHSEYGIATYYIIAPSEASSNLARYDGAHFGHRTTDHSRSADQSALVSMYSRSRSEGFGPEVKRRIMLGTFALSSGYMDAYYLKALKVRRLIRQDYDNEFEKVDFLIGPVCPTAAFPLGERADDPLAMYLGDICTVTTNLAGIAGISIPCGFTDSGLPIGLQIQARPFDEVRLLQIAHMYQQQTDWHQRLPTLGTGQEE